jgi:hypothetical protein
MVHSADETPKHLAIRRRDIPLARPDQNTQALQLHFYATNRKRVNEQEKGQVLQYSIRLLSIARHDGVMNANRIADRL